MLRTTRAASRRRDSRVALHTHLHRPAQPERSYSRAIIGIHEAQAYAQGITRLRHCRRTTPPPAQRASIICTAAVHVQYFYIDTNAQPTCSLPYLERLRRTSLPPLARTIARSVRTRIHSLHAPITHCTLPFSWLGSWFVAARRVRSLVKSAVQAEVVLFVDMITHRSVFKGSCGPFDITHHAHAYWLDEPCQGLRHF